MRLKFQHTLADIMELNRSARDQRIGGWIVVLMGIAMMLVGISVAIFPSDKAAPMEFFPWAIIFVVLGLSTTRIAGFGAWFLKVRRAPPYEIEINQDGLAFLNGGQPVVVAWTNFSRWFETKNLLVLLAPEDAVAIPKRGTNCTEIEELANLVRSKLGTASRW